MAQQDTLIIVSTRLPVSVQKHNGELVFHQSNGGLATGVSFVSRSRNSVWVGWPGIPSDDLTKKDKIQITERLKQYKCHPIFLTQQQVDLYYGGYCNATIWPLFHYFTSKAEHNAEYWKSYCEVNALFEKEVSRFVTDASQIWVHDYQLMLLPELIRKKHRQALIGFFLHTPFPSFEIFRLLPEREALLHGLLGADLIGCHTYDYVRHFLSSVQRTLGHESKLGVIKFDDRIVQADAFPIGIDYDRFAKWARLKTVKRRVATMNIRKSKTRVILAVDRADYSKGIPARLDAFELFLKQNPDYLEKVVLVLLASPSRENVEAYQTLRFEIEQKVSRINGDYSTVDWAPITYLHKTLPQEEVSALYSMADVMLVTPLRDGMNLVAKEFVATKHKQDGVLILSEMAGVASELPEALLVNPNDTEFVADAIKRALEMPKSEQKSRMLAMQSRISEYTIGKWAEDFLTQLTRTREKQSRATKHLNSNYKKQLIADYLSAERRLILLDYDGTLKEFAPSPIAKYARPSLKLVRVLRRLTKDQKNKVTIVSGRQRSVLSSFFEGMGLDLVAEHGGWILNAGQWVKSSFVASKWKKQAVGIMEAYTSRTPGSLIEEKDFAVVWHYRNVSPDLAFVRAEELKMELQSALSHADVGVFDGKKIVEVKPERMHKGALAGEIVSEEKWDFIMAIGDDYTDEDMFAVLPERSYTIQVGEGDTRARFQLGSVSSVVSLIEELSRLSPSRSKGK